MAERGIKVIAENRKARHDYFVLDTYETGIALTGTEVKSLRAGRVNLKESYAQVTGGELYLESAHISPYEQGNRYNPDPLRRRKLLMHKREILRLYGQVKQEGLTLVPLKFYFSRGKVKVELALCKGKKLYDKRDAAAAKDARREVERAFRDRR
ncbi:MAG: SsrA-binding protein SmpB [Peptococcaceae bacterium]|jgi:SsrA-binding protein|nr:SsrA-binding protein SmpB [Peptococcaceae bacterium]